MARGQISLPSDKRICTFVSLPSSPGSSGQRVPAFPSRDGSLSSRGYPRPVTPLLRWPEIAADVRWKTGASEWRDRMTRKRRKEGQMRGTCTWL
jgi:hypothetical protein